METIKYEAMRYAMQGIDEKGLGIPFAISGYKADRQKQKAGEPFKYIKARLSSKTKVVQRQSIRKRKKFAYHDQHKTINITLPNGDIRKVNLRLITFFNQMRVKW